MLRRSTGLFSKTQFLSNGRGNINNRCNVLKLSSVNPTQRRNLGIHEYQSQQLMKESGISVPPGEIATTPEEAYKIAKSYEKDGHIDDELIDVVLKAQVLSGGRGLGYFDGGLQGGVHTCTSANEVKELSKQMLGHRLKTKQTPPEGALCNKVLVTERLFTRHEGYLAIFQDRETNGPLVVASAKGGTDIESVAKYFPSAIKKFPIDIFKGISDEEADNVAVAMGFGAKRVKSQAADIVKKMYDLFIKYDCIQAEINPLVEDLESRVAAVDAKFNFDPNAEFRQERIFSMKDKTQADLREVAASQAGLNYIGLDGSIGCLVNGAGLAMATMDIIKLHGGSPANFLDVGGGATETQVIDAFKILKDDPRVRSILVNIFGGIMRCDVIAGGILNAVKKLGLDIPLVVRLQGTNVDEAKAMLETSGLRILAAENLDEAARKAVKVSEIVDMARGGN